MDRIKQKMDVVKYLDKNMLFSKTDVMLISQMYCDIAGESTPDNAYRLKVFAQDCEWLRESGFIHAIAQDDGSAYVYCDYDSLERFRDECRKFKYASSANTRGWVALVLSIIAIIVSIISLCTQFAD